MKTTTAVPNNRYSETTALPIYLPNQSSAVPVVIPVVYDGEGFEPRDVGRYSILDVADWFLSKEAMTHQKLQKLCYYAQAWCFAVNGYRLATTDFEAWENGPISSFLWERFKSFGYDSIKYHGKPKEIFKEEDLRILEDVWDTYGNESALSLEALTKRELPWIEARKGYVPSEKCFVIISPATMKAFYAEMNNE